MLKMVAAMIAALYILAVSATSALAQNTPPAAVAPAAKSSAMQIADLTLKFEKAESDIASLKAKLAAPAPTAPDGKALCQFWAPCKNAVADEAGKIQTVIKTIKVKIADPSLLAKLRLAELELAKLTERLGAQAGLAQHNAEAAKGQLALAGQVLAMGQHPELAKYARCRGGFKLRTTVYTPTSSTLSLDCEREVDLARVEKVEGPLAAAQAAAAARQPLAPPPAPEKKSGRCGTGCIIAAITIPAAIVGAVVVGALLATREDHNTVVTPTKTTSALSIRFKGL
ncbi:hypothetical protein EPN28_01270 [Patescibacteria group bacterium]|nr:MAG: hypothetical protein EPN28_01270 [Patescibacteria group bacterium]